MVESIETMDPDISRWVAEFLLRSSFPNSFVSEVVNSLNQSKPDPKLTKTFHLRLLRSEINNASIIENSLDLLEQLEPIDPNEAVLVLDSMRKAYCAVAVECTVKFLSATSDGVASTEYISAVERIWHGRVVELERRKSKLFSDEIAQWRNDIEAAVSDSRVFERLAKLNTRYDAFSAVRVYLQKVWETMGPCFLESLAEMTWKDRKKNYKEKGSTIRVLDPVPQAVAEGSRKDACRNSSGSGQTRDHGDDEKENENHHENVNDNDNDGAHCMEGVGVNGGHEEKEQMEERAKGSVDGTQEPAKGEKATEKGNPQLKRKLPAFLRCHKGVKISSAEELSIENSRSKNGTEKSAEDKIAQESLKSSFPELRAFVKVPLPEALNISDVVGSKLAQKGRNQERPMENKSGDVDVPSSNTCRATVLCQPKDAEKESVHHSRVQVQHPNLREQNSTAHVSSNLREQNSTAPNLREQNSTARQSPNLKEQNSTAHESPNLREQNNTAHVSSNLREQNSTAPNLREQNSTARQSPNLKEQNSTAHESPNLREQNNTAHDDERDDSKDDLASGVQLRRRKRKWSSLEEDTLRTGVNRFGVGNWATIQSYYRNIFDNRRPVDLKDKWRNMTRY